MAKCAACGSAILFGGVSDAGMRFCNPACQRHGLLLVAAEHVDPEWLAQSLRELHQGNCPVCGGPGPVDVHVSHTIWSLVLLSSSQSTPKICCRRCGAKAKLGAAFFSAIAGWWGFPWGLIFTPIQIGRNLVGMLSPPDPAHPSPELEHAVRINLGAQLVAATRQSQADPSE